MPVMICFEASLRVPSPTPSQCATRNDTTYMKMLGFEMICAHPLSGYSRPPIAPAFRLIHDSQNISGFV